jgi:hypothetical protein
MSAPNQTQLEQIVFKNRNILYKYLGEREINFLKSSDYCLMKKLFQLTTNEDELFLKIVNGYDSLKNEHYNDLRIVIRYIEDKELVQRVELSLDKSYKYHIDLTYSY